MVSKLTHPQMIQEMKTAIQEEIKETKQKGYKHIASDGKILSNQPGSYIYIFTLSEPWEPQDDASLKITLSGSRDIKGTLVNSTGATITIVTNKSLPPEALDKIILEEDPTELLERLHDALEKNQEGPTSLGSKTFGLIEPKSARRSTSTTFGAKFQPDESQHQAIQQAMGSEVTFIVGPPGTGKTSTLAAIAFAYLQEGRNILIAAYTNIAIDNAIMKLADLCRDTGNNTELDEGRIVRYGAPQLLTQIQNGYKDVYLPAIIKRRSSTLQSQHNQIEGQINQLTEQTRLIEEQKKPWVEKYQLLQEQLKKCTYELTDLEKREQQRIKQFNDSIKTLLAPQASAKQEGEFCQKNIAQYVAQQTQWQTEKMQLQSQERNLQLLLAEAQQANVIKRFRKQLNPQKLALQLGEIAHQIYQYDYEISQIQAALLQSWHPRLASANEKLRQINNQIKHIEIQMQQPSPDSIKLNQLRSHKTECEQKIAEIKTNLSALQSSSNTQKLTDNLEQLREQRAAIDKQLAAMEKSVVAEARVVATTLSKTYMNANLRERRFDVVILDEVSMAPLPTVYIAASRADRAVIAIGDPQQLAPIYHANKNELAQKWLGQDLFDLNMITLEDAARQSHNSVLLQQQSRMHPHISHIANEHVYQRLIQDHQRIRETRKGYAEVKPLVGKALILCDTSDYPSIALRVPNGGSHQNTYHALCSFQVAYQVLATLPEPRRSLQDGEFRIGIVTPYRSQADLLQGMVKDAGLNKYIRVGTVHRFQGLEAEAIIFDTVESLPIQPDPPFRLTSGKQRSNAMRLVNVAITCAQQKLVIVANREYIKRYFDPQDTLRLVVEEAACSGVILSADVLKNADISLPKWVQDVKVDTFPELLDDRSFYKYFIPDLKNAKKQVTIFSPFLTKGRIDQLEANLVDKIKQGTRIDAIYSPPREYDKRKEYEELAQRLRAMQIRLHTKTEMHEKIVFIDDNIAYIGSLNVLSHGQTTECMQRILSPAAIKRYKKDWQVETILALPEKEGSLIDVSFNELPNEGSTCTQCNRKMRRWYFDKYNFYAFYSCSGFPECKNREEISKIHFEKIVRLTSIRCQQCKGPTRIETVRKDAWIVCAAASSCGYGQPIKIKR